MSSQNHLTDSLLAVAKYSEEVFCFEDCNRLFDYIVNGICEIIGCHQSSIMMFDSQTYQLRLIKAHGFNVQNYKTPRVELSDHVDHWLYEGGEVFALMEQGKSDFLIVFDEEERKYFDCELRVPLYAQGKLVGVLNLGKKGPGIDYSSRDITLLRILTNTTSMALERAIYRHSTSANQNERRWLQNPNYLDMIKIKRRVPESAMIGCSEAMQKVKLLIDRVAPKDVTVLITGESGTGKELVAREIHRKSSRCDRPLVAMNCAAMPENLVESELFGHEKGAFTGAHCQKKGKFEFADGGTLFLDEIGDMSIATQAKVLRVLQESSFQRIGANQTITVDVRVITATNKNLAQEMSLGHFREDLFYRVNVVQIHVPALRERREDIPLLAEYFLNKYNQFYGKNIRQITGDAMQRLIRYDFPGNIRELQNLIERAVIMGQGEELSLDFAPNLSSNRSCSFNDTKSSLEEIEKEYIKQVMQQVHQNKSQAARILGIARKTLREKMQRYGL